MKKSGLLILILISLCITGFSQSSWQLMAKASGFNQATSINISDSCICVGTNKGILMSKDAGTSWTCVSSNDYIYCMTGNNTYASTYKKILISDDKGLSWNHMTNEIDGGGNISAMSISTNELLIGNENGYFFSTSDTGQTWTEITGISGQGMNMLWYASGILKIGNRIITSGYSSTDGNISTTVVNGSNYIWTGSTVGGNVKITDLKQNAGIVYASTEDGKIFVSVDTAKHGVILLII